MRDLNEGWVGKGAAAHPGGVVLPSGGQQRRRAIGPDRVRRCGCRRSRRWRIFKLQARGGGEPPIGGVQQQFIEYARCLARRHEREPAGRVAWISVQPRRHPRSTPMPTAAACRSWSCSYQPRKVPYPNSGAGESSAPGGPASSTAAVSGLVGPVLGVTLDGFDTHAGQAGPHANLLCATRFRDAISAFYRDLSQRGHRDRLLIMTFSEFGRRAKENGSRGNHRPRLSGPRCSW